MALATYADLQAAIANYLARPGDTLVSGPAPDFVSLAESRIAYGSSGQWPCRPLRIRAMEKTALLMTAPAVNALSVAGSANVITCVAGLTSLTFPTPIAFTAALSNTAAATLKAHRPRA